MQLKPVDKVEDISSNDFRNNYYIPKHHWLLPGGQNNGRTLLNGPGIILKKWQVK